MGLYSNIVVPFLCDIALRSRHVGKLRERVLSPLTGEILEIGFGTGLNLPHYPETVKRITTLEPNPGMTRKAAKRVREARISVEQHAQSSEAMPFADASFDFVVSTFTMCSIQKLETAIVEMHRVLRPGGQLIFLEHGLSENPKVAKWQHRLNRAEMLLADGCRLDRDYSTFLQESAFDSFEIQRFLMKQSPQTHGSLYQGVAVKR